MQTFDQTLRSFLKAAGSAAPTPGGGSVAAVAAALGASMGAMVTQLTTGPKYAAVQGRMSAAAEQMQQATQAAETIAGQDIESFQQYMNALGLPKSTAAEKETRSQAIQAASLRSTEVPLRLMQLCLSWMKELAEITASANTNVISDLAIAFIMLEAAAQSAWVTAEINLSAVKDQDRVEWFRREGGLLASQCTALKLEELRKIKERMAV